MNLLKTQKTRKISVNYHPAVFIAKERLIGRYLELWQSWLRALNFSPA